MFRTIRPATRTTVATGLATLCQILDDMPSIGVEPRRDGIGGLPQEEADEVLLAAGPVVVYRRGGWGSRFTTLPLLAVGLDERMAAPWLPRQPECGDSSVPRAISFR